MSLWTNSRASLLRAVPGVFAVAFVAALSSPSPAPAAKRLAAGSKITAPYACTYLPGNILDGTKTRFVGIESTGAYTLVPTPNLPGGHWELHGEYPKASYFSFQGYNRFTQVNGFLDGKDIAPDPGSVNPWQPGQLYKPGSTFTLRVDFTPPAQRKHPQPPGVMYMGYRGGPGGVGRGYDQLGGVLSTFNGMSGLLGGVPLPRATWVVDDPARNRMQNKQQLCAAMYIQEQPTQTLVAGVEALVNPTISAQRRALEKVFFPLVVDPISGWNRRPYVNVFRPSPYGYSWPMFPAAANFTFTAPSPVYGKFFVIRFKAPTYSRVSEGIPNTGDEQTGYWVWCGDQPYSLIVNSTDCINATEFRPDSQGYVTLVFSPASQRPTIDGKPYEPWIAHPGAGGAAYRLEFGANPATYPQSPYFAPPSMAMNPRVAGWADTIQGMTKERQLKQHMGEYYPQVYYCTKQKFEAGQCKPPADGTAAGQGASTTPPAR